MIDINSSQMSTRSLYWLDQKMEALPGGIRNIAGLIRLVFHMVIGIFALLGMALGGLISLVSCSKKPLNFAVFIAQRNVDELMRGGCDFIGLNGRLDAAQAQKELNGDSSFLSFGRAYGKYVYTSPDGSYIAYSMHQYATIEWDSQGRARGQNRITTNI